MFLANSVSGREGSGSVNWDWRVLVIAFFVGAGIAGCAFLLAFGDDLSTADSAKSVFSEGQYLARGAAGAGGTASMSCSVNKVTGKTSCISSSKLRSGGSDGPGTPTPVIATPVATPDPLASCIRAPVERALVRTDDCIFVHGKTNDYKVEVMSVTAAAVQFRVQKILSGGMLSRIGTYNIRPGYLSVLSSGAFGLDRIDLFVSEIRGGTSAYVSAYVAELPEGVLVDGCVQAPASNLRMYAYDCVFVRGNSNDYRATFLGMSGGRALLRLYAKRGTSYQLIETQYLNGASRVISGTRYGSDQLSVRVSQYGSNFIVAAVSNAFWYPTDVAAEEPSPYPEDVAAEEPSPYPEDVAAEEPSSSTCPMGSMARVEVRETPFGPFTALLGSCFGFSGVSNEYLFEVIDVSASFARVKVSKKVSGSYRTIQLLELRGEWAYLSGGEYGADSLAVRASMFEPTLVRISIDSSAPVSSMCPMGSVERVDVEGSSLGPFTTRLGGCFAILGSSNEYLVEVVDLLSDSVGLKVSKKTGSSYETIELVRLGEGETRSVSGGAYELDSLKLGASRFGSGIVRVSLDIS